MPAGCSRESTLELVMHGVWPTVSPAFAGITPAVILRRASMRQLLESPRDSRFREADHRRATRARRTFVAELATRKLQLRMIERVEERAGHVPVLVDDELLDTVEHERPVVFDDRIGARAVGRD